MRSMSRILARKPEDREIEHAILSFVKEVEYDLKMVERAPGWKVTPIRQRLIGFRQRLRTQKANADYVKRLTNALDLKVPVLQYKLKLAEQARTEAHLSNQLESEDIAV